MTPVLPPPLSEQDYAQLTHEWACDLSVSKAAAARLRWLEEQHAALVGMVKRLLGEVGHLEVCAHCAEGPMSECDGGREVIETIAAADRLLSALSPSPRAQERTE